MNFEMKDKYGMDDLIKIVKCLRAPDGCPWDKVQTHQSIRQDFIEEVYEAVEAIDDDDSEHLREELGDVLLQVVFHSVLEEEQGHFVFEDTVDDVCKKLILRHPHVFGDVEANTTEEVLKNWDAIKMQSKSQTTAAETMDSVSKTLPSLMRCQKLHKKAERGGLKPLTSDEAFDDAAAQLAALRVLAENEDTAACEQAVGALLFSLGGLAKQMDVDCEQSLYRACDDFTEQFRSLEGLAAEKGISIQTSDPDTIRSLWGEVNNSNRRKLK